MGGEATMSKTHTLYRIYYGPHLVYLGRTNQPLQSRLRGHFFGRPMHRKLELPKVTRIEQAQLPTEADMYVYEVYYINKLKPLLNRDDLSYSELNVELPELEWSEFVPPRMDAWREEIERRDYRYQAQREEANELFVKSCEVRRADPEAACELREQARRMQEGKW